MGCVNSICFLRDPCRDQLDNAVSVCCRLRRKSRQVGAIIGRINVLKQGMTRVSRPLLCVLCVLCVLCMLCMLCGSLDHAGLAGTAHQRTELTFFIVIDKQLLGQDRLIVQHVDQETQGTQIIPKMIKNDRQRRRRHNGIRSDHAFDHFPHAQNRLCGLLKTQHGQNTAHLRQLARHSAQHTLVTRVAEKHIQRRLHFCQRGSQLSHYAAHRLFITDSPVQLFHPALQRLWRAPGANVLKTLCQTRHTQRHLRIVGVQIFKRRFQIKH